MPLDNVEPKGSNILLVQGAVLECHHVNIATSDPLIRFFIKINLKLREWFGSDDEIPRRGGMSQEQIDAMLNGAGKVSSTLDELTGVIEDATLATNNATDSVTDAAQTLEQSAHSIEEAADSIKTSVNALSDTIDKGTILNEQLALAAAKIEELTKNIEEKENELLLSKEEISLLKTALKEQNEIFKTLESTIQTALIAGLAEKEMQKQQINVLEKQVVRQANQLLFFKAALPTRSAPVVEKESVQFEHSLSQF